jgi:hypothetical protein
MGATVSKYSFLNCKNDYELVVKSSKELERILHGEQRRGRRKSLREAALKTSNLSPQLESDIRYFIGVRNLLIHQPGYEAIPDKKAFIEAFKRAANQLEKLSKPKVATTGRSTRRARVTNWQGRLQMIKQQEALHVAHEKDPPPETTSSLDNIPSAKQKGHTERVTSTDDTIRSILTGISFDDDGYNSENIELDDTFTSLALNVVEQVNVADKKASSELVMAVDKKERCSRSQTKKRRQKLQVGMKQRSVDIADLPDNKKALQQGESTTDIHLVNDNEKALIYDGAALKSVHLDINGSTSSSIYAKNARKMDSTNTVATLRRSLDGNESERLFNVDYILSRISKDKDINVGAKSSLDEGVVKSLVSLSHSPRRERKKQIVKEVTVKKPEPTLPSAPDAKPWWLSR